MTKIKYIAFAFILLLGVFNYPLKAQNNIVTDSLTQAILKTNIAKKEISELKSNPVKVNVIFTCSTNPSLCGTMAFGSVCLVKILEGNYVGEIIYVASTCTETNYKVGENYKLNVSVEPEFSVHLCNGKVYNPNWNINLTENKYLMIFGKLNLISKE